MTLTPEEIVQKYLGTKYRNNGRSIKEGLDCWGLVMGITKDLFNCDLPDTEYQWTELIRNQDAVFERFDISKWVKPVDKPKVGDFILMNVIVGCPIHVGIYIGNSKIIQAMTAGVALTDYRTTIPQIEGIYRLLNQYRGTRRGTND